MRRNDLKAGNIVIASITAVLLTASGGSAQHWGGWKAEKSAEKQEKKRQEIDAIAKETLAKLFVENPEAESLFGLSYGWAVFDSHQTKFMVSGGGGDGVAVERNSGKRTYMKTASLGVGVGFGVQFYQVVFLFETAEVMENFVENGWEVAGGANAVAGDEGANLQVTATDTDQVAAGANASGGFASGIAVFQFTEKGYMLQADIAGTKYWKDKKLNQL
jgi:lipid-binding SYLF domain-containing protein